MKTVYHVSAKASHYDKSAKYYDKFNEENSKIINTTLEQLLNNSKVNSVLDLTCGTGSQVFWLTKKGYQVTGADINSKMLKIAKEKIKKEQLNVKLMKGDMRHSQLGQFDAVITLFNAIGHLTKKDFERALKNIYYNLKANGLYVFDINNLSYLRKGNNISQLTIDWLETMGDVKARKIQYSTVDEQGILASYTTSIIQTKNNKLKISHSQQTLQIYTLKQLQAILSKNGFEVIKKCSVDGSRFIETKSDRIMLVARKQ